MTEKPYGIICGHCQKWNAPKEVIESLHRFANGVIHVRGECQYCRAYLKYVPYSESHTVRNILHKVYRKEPLEEILIGVVIYDEKAKEIF